MTATAVKKRPPLTTVPAEPEPLDIFRVDAWKEMLNGLPGTGSDREDSLKRYLTDQAYREAERARLVAEEPPWPWDQMGGVEYADLSRSLKERLETAQGWVLTLAQDEEHLSVLDDTEYRAELKKRQPDASWPVPGLTDEDWHAQFVSDQD